jgi:flagellar protein FlbD
MIPLTRINQSPFFLNIDLIEIIESTPDTMITLTTGAKLLVAEQVDLVVARVEECRRREKAA